MTQIVKEITSGTQFTRSLEEGVVADSQNRVFKVVLSSPQETINIQQACGVFIGNRHPYNPNIYCHTFDAKYDGDSRMVLICTFQYKSKAGSSEGLPDPQAVDPEVRPANWTTSVATYESPVTWWQTVDSNGDPVNRAGDAPAERSPATNPVGDFYDGLTRLEPIITISVEQYEAFDPLRNNEAVGCINEKQVNVGRSLSCERATLLLRSIQSSPVVESWGDAIYRGWKATYEFLYKRNPSRLARYNGEDGVDRDIGWDIAVPQTGFNVKAFNPNGAADNQDIFAQPLRHSAGKIVGPPYALFDNVAVGDKVRAMVKVFEYENGGASQTPSAQPIPLNNDGTPRLYTVAAPKEKVLVYRYRVYKEYDFNTLGLRLT